MGLNNFTEIYPEAYKLKFSETKGACHLAYDAVEREKYLFPNGKIWEVVAKKEDWSGYRSILLKPENDSRVILAFAGTNPTSLGDLITDFAQETGLLPRQYQWAANEALNYKCQYGSNLILTGHSLGGGLATYASLLYKIPTTTLNPAPLAENTVFKYTSNGTQCFTVSVTNYISEGEEFISSNGLWGIVPAGILRPFFGNKAYETLVEWEELPKLMVAGKRIRVNGGKGILSSGIGKFYTDHMIPDTAPEVPLPERFGKAFGSVPRPSKAPTPVANPTAVPTPRGTPTAR